MIARILTRPARAALCALVLAAPLAVAACQQDKDAVLNEIRKSEREAEAKRLAAATANAASSEAFLEANKAKAGVTVTASGLQVEKVRVLKGDGPRPGPGDQVLAHYEGTLPDGTVFDSSYARNEPAAFRLDQVIPGWTEGLQLMRPGEEFRFVVPAALGYGDRGAGEDIGPNQALVFRVELLAFARPDGTIVEAPKS